MTTSFILIATEKKTMKALWIALLAAAAFSACQPGPPLYDNNGKYWVRLIGDTVTCHPEQGFFFWVDGALLYDETRDLSQVLFIDAGEHIIEARCSNKAENKWRDTLRVTGDTVLVVTCETCD